MILSEKYKFIFIHIPKTAGTSVADAFGKYGKASKYSHSSGRSLFRSITRRLPIKEAPGKAHFRDHETASKIASKLTRPVFDTFTSFAVIRNPFDQAVSHYEFMKQFKRRDVAQKFEGMGFREYLEYRIRNNRWQGTIFARLPNQSYYLTDSKGEMLVQRLVHFEKLNEELLTLADDLGLPEFQLRHINKTKSRAKSRQYQDYYDRETIKLVLEIYAEDFERFGYSTSL